MGCASSSQIQNKYRKRNTGLKQDEEPFVMVTYDPEIEFRPFTKCPDHDVYTNRPLRCQSLPRVTPPTERRDVPHNWSDTIDSVTITETLTVKELVKGLIHGSHVRQQYSDTEKIAILYDWLTNIKIDTDTQCSPTVDFQTVIYQLDRLKKQTNTYAAFFSLLCHYAKVACVIIEGHVKGSRYVAGDILNDSFIYEWNAVLVDNQWQLVDTFWGSYLEEGVHWPIRWYLFPDPREFIYTHYPRSSIWQLLEEPISMKDFIKLAVLKDFYFDQKSKNKIALAPEIGEDNCYLEATHGEFDFVFRVDSDTQAVSCRAHQHTLYPEGLIWEERELKRQLIVKHINRKTVPQKAEIKVRFPSKGTYEVGVLFKQHMARSWMWGASFRVHVATVPNWAFLFLGDINKDIIQRVRMLRTPVDELVTIMKAVLLLVGIEEEEIWELIQWQLHREHIQKFYDKMIQINVDQLKPDYVDKAKHIMGRLPPKVTPAKGEDIAAFTKWVHTVLELYDSFQYQNRMKLGSNSRKDLAKLSEFEEPSFESSLVKDDD